MHQKQSKKISIFNSEHKIIAWTVLSLLYFLCAFLVLQPHWGLTVEDSLAYFNTSRFLRGEIQFSELRAPFPYRLLIPAVAAYIPGDLRNVFASVNWVSISISSVFLAYSVNKVGGNCKQVICAGLLLIISVPTFWYGSYLLTDPGAICARTIFVVGILTGQPWLSLFSGLIATAIREENILLLVWLLVFQRKMFIFNIGAIAVAVAWLIYVRWYFFAGLPSYVWVPSLNTILAVMHDTRAVLSILSAAIVVVPLLILGFKHIPSELNSLKSLIILMSTPILYAALSVRVDGRAIWSLYPFMIPIAVYARFHMREDRRK
ncbi:hypothetical protein [Duganella fentianensis]|uniref:hypothetical protein n=1 Tax=Duganella fentianensis TaxID=2692177 RepID=UPI0032B24CDF